MFNPLVCFAQDRSREVVIDCFYSVPYLMIGLFLLGIIVYAYKTPNIEKVF